MPTQPQPFEGPHQGQSVMSYGTPLEEASTAVIMIHGRGATARDILSLAFELDVDGDIAYLAPQAANFAWYPRGFMEAMSSNEPFLSSALVTVNDLVKHIEKTGIPRENIVLMGFSQGACLTLEYVARNAERYGGVVAFSGGVIGPDGSPRDYEGSLDGTPIFIGCSDVDFHIPVGRVNESATVMENLGADVDKRIYQGMGHTINQDELKAAQELLQSVIAD